VDNQCSTDCGDGEIAAGVEACEQTAGFPMMSEACNEDCEVRPNYVCDESSGSLACRLRCGNGVTENPE